MCPEELARPLVDPASKRPMPMVMTLQRQAKLEVQPQVHAVEMLAEWRQGVVLCAGVGLPWREGGGVMLGR